MKIGIEAQRVFRKKKHGMDMVVLELIRNLQQIDTQNQYLVFARPDEDMHALQESKNVKIVLLNGGPYPLWEQFSLPAAARRHGCDILHCTSNTAPVRGKVPLITTLHDIIYMEKHPLLARGGTLYQKFGNTYRRCIVPAVVRRSRKVITVSEFEKKRIMSYFGLGPDKLHAVYNGVGDHFRVIHDSGYLQQMREKYKLPERFVFFLGNTDPKKNTPNVLRAVHDFLKTVPEDYRLVMLDYDEDKLVATLRSVQCEDLRSRIHLTGYVPNAELPAIINQAHIFLYPSLRESFGIPILEGMACGVPVITSNTSSMPEVAGQAALLVDPSDWKDISAKMKQLNEDKDLYERLREKGIERAAVFSWKSMAEHVLELYKEMYRANS